MRESGEKARLRERSVLGYPEAKICMQLSYDPSCLPFLSDEALLSLYMRDHILLNL